MRSSRDSTCAPLCMALHTCSPYNACHLASLSLPRIYLVAPRLQGGSSEEPAALHCFGYTVHELQGPATLEESFEVALQPAPHAAPAAPVTLPLVCR